MDWQDQTAPDARLDLIDGNSDLHSVCGFELWSSEQGWRRIVKTVVRAACQDILRRRAFGSHQEQRLQQLAPLMSALEPAFAIACK